MEETYNLQAFVLNRQPFREADLKVVLYTAEKGKISLIARGGKKSKSKLSPHLEPMNLSSVMAVKGKFFDYAGSAVSRNCFLNIKRDLEKIKFAGQAIAAFNKLVKEDDEEEARDLFDLLKEYLEVFNDYDIDNNLFFSFFTLKLLAFLGLSPELRNCVQCHKEIITRDSFFDFSKGGLICENCRQASSFRICDNTIKLLILATKKDFLSLSKILFDNKNKKEAIKIIDSFYKYHA